MMPKPSAFFFASVIFWLLAIAEYIAILTLNHGFFVFSLDDPYIHLSLAENISRGHYGVNLQEYSAPSSSILWPFLILPFTLFADGETGLLLFNLLLAWLSLAVFNRILDYAEQARQQALTFNTRLLLLAAFIIVANLVGLAFIGMEHNLQVLAALLLLLLIIRFWHEQSVSLALYACIIVLPLIRYETAVLSAAALLFLFIHRFYWQSLLTGLILLACLLLFSGFLLSLGLGFLPDSVMAKSDVAANGLMRLLSNLQRNLAALSPPMPKGFILLGLCIYLIVLTKQQSNRAIKWFTWTLCLAIFLHLLGGRIGWFWRYELYLWSVLAGLVVYLQLVKPNKAQFYLLLVMAFASLEHFIALAVTPLASSNIYLQQYQMHRFVDEFYQKPIAVNDLGWTSYHNQNYVLDLWGLGSSEARQLRHSSQDASWLDDIVKRHGVELVMIYHHPIWFKDVPDNWILLGTLDSDRLRVVSLMPVSFFTPCASCVEDLQSKLSTFAETLPKGAFFTFTGKNQLKNNNIE